MSTKKKYDGKRPATIELDNQGRPIPVNLELNKHLVEHMDPLETNDV